MFFSLLLLCFEFSIIIIEVKSDFIEYYQYVMEENIYDTIGLYLRWQTNRKTRRSI